MARLELIRLINEDGHKESIANIIRVTNMAGEIFYIKNHRISLVDPNLVKVKDVL